jgi:hypothetical protein
MVVDYVCVNVVMCAGSQDAVDADTHDVAWCCCHRCCYHHYQCQCQPQFLVDLACCAAAATHEALPPWMTRLTLYDDFMHEIYTERKIRKVFIPHTYTWAVRSTGRGKVMLLYGGAQNANTLSECLYDWLAPAASRLGFLINHIVFYNLCKWCGRAAT